MTSIYEKRFNDLKSEFLINEVYLSDAVIALNECAKEFENKLIKTRICDTANNLLMATGSIYKKATTSLDEPINIMKHYEELSDKLSNKD